MTTTANSQLGMRSSTLFFCTVFCEQLELILQDLPHFTSPNRTKMSANKSLKSRTKMSANKSFKSNYSRVLWGKAAQIQMFRSVNERNFEIRFVGAVPGICRNVCTAFVWRSGQAGVRRVVRTFFKNACIHTGNA